MNLKKLIKIKDATRFSVEYIRKARQVEEPIEKTKVLVDGLLAANDKRDVKEIGNKLLDVCLHQSKYGISWDYANFFRTIKSLYDKIYGLKMTPYQPDFDVAQKNKIVEQMKQKIEEFEAGDFYRSYSDDKYSDLI